MKKILIAEDEVPLREALKAKLSENQFEVLEAKDGEEAVQIAKINHPDMVLLDIIMPKMNGLDVLKSFKDDAALAKIPIYVLTNLSEQSSEKMAMDSGAEEYLIKSNLKLEDLVSKIKTRLGEKND